MLLTNGRIYTLDPGDSVVDTLAVRDGRVAFAGRRGDVNASAGEQVVDLGGRAVLPGLVDAHAHLMLLARSRLSLDLSRAQSEDEIACLVASAAGRTAEGEWISGQGWDQTRWPEQRFPTRASLDRAAARHPVALTRVDGHATWANSAALAAAGVDRHLADPPGGRIARGGDGEPTGLLIDTAQELVRAVQPVPSPARFERALREALAHCLSTGLTGLHEMGVDLDTLAVYRSLAERGQFPLRNHVAVSGRKAWAHYRERGVEAMEGGRVIVGAVKLWLDGALGSRGAALHAPYSDDPGNAGLILVPPEEVERWTVDALAHGFQMCVHAIGDRANALALDAFERALATTSPATRADHRLRVEHAQILAESDIPRFARLGVIPSMQPTHCTSDMRWAGARLGPARLAGAYAWRSLLSSGSRIAGGSDFPVEDANPFHGIYAAVARRALTGDGPGWQPEQRMTRAEAVRAFTTWNAYASRRDADLGSLEPGKRADLVVLSDDVFTCPEERIRDIVPALTMIAGETVFAREARAP
jgi:predicted amidohydrolase YtcJ